MKHTTPQKPKSKATRKTLALDLSPGLVKAAESYVTQRQATEPGYSLDTFVEEVAMREIHRRGGYNDKGPRKNIVLAESFLDVCTRFGMDPQLLAARVVREWSQKEHKLVAGDDKRLVIPDEFLPISEAFGMQPERLAAHVLIEFAHNPPATLTISGKSAQAADHERRMRNLMERHQGNERAMERLRELAEEQDDINDIGALRDAADVLEADSERTRNAIAAEKGGK